MTITPIVQMMKKRTESLNNFPKLVRGEIGISPAWELLTFRSIASYDVSSPTVVVCPFGPPQNVPVPRAS